MSNENNSEYYDENGYVICQYCLKPLKLISKHHLKFHDLTLDEYKEMYPDAPIRWNGAKKSKMDNVSNNENHEINIAPISIDENAPLTKDVAYLILKNMYPNIQKNYIYKKLDRNGNILFTFHVDFGDPSKRILIDFESMQWHAYSPLFTKYRKKELASQAKWKYLNIDNEFHNIEEFQNFLKK